MSDALRSWLDERVDERAARERGLRADSRDDEATFARIDGNVYDIVRTVLDVAKRQSPGDGRAAREFFLGRIDRLREEWSAARERAAAHDDAERVHVENVKLGALAEARAAAGELWAA